MLWAGRLSRRAVGLTPFLRCNPKETRKLYGYGSVPFTKRSAVQKGIHTHVHNAPLHSRKLSDILLVAQAGTLHIAERRLLSTNTPSTHQASVVNQYHSGIASKINSRSSSRSDTDPLSVNSHMDRRPVLNILGRAPRQWPEFLPFLPNSIATFIYRKTIYAEFKTLVNCASTWSMLITITAFLAMPSEDKSKYDLELPLELIESAGGQGRKELWPLIYRMASLWAYRDQKWLSLSEQYYLMRINLNRIQDFYKSKQPRSARKHQNYLSETHAYYRHLRRDSLPASLHLEYFDVLLLSPYSRHKIAAVRRFCRAWRFDPELARHPLFETILCRIMYASRDPNHGEITRNRLRTELIDVINLQLMSQNATQMMQKTNSATMTIAEGDNRPTPYHSTIPDSSLLSGKKIKSSGSRAGGTSTEGPFVCSENSAVSLSESELATQLPLITSLKNLNARMKSEGGLSGDIYHQSTNHAERHQIIRNLRWPRRIIHSTANHTQRLRKIQAQIMQVTQYRSGRLMPWMSLKVASLIRRTPTLCKHTAGFALDTHLRAGRVRAAEILLRRMRAILPEKDFTQLGNRFLAGLSTTVQQKLHRSVGKGYSHRRDSWLIVISTFEAMDNLRSVHGFLPDRVTVNILLSAVLKSNHPSVRKKLRPLFDQIVQVGYPGRSSGLLPFSCQSRIEPPIILPVPNSLPISPLKHVIPLYRSFLLAFTRDGDVEACQIVANILAKKGV